MVNSKGFENNNGVAHDSWFGLNLVTGMGGYRRREEFLLVVLEAELLMKKISMDLYSFMCSNFYILTLFQSLKDKILNLW